MAVDPLLDRNRWPLRDSWLLFYELTLIISDRAAEQPKCYSGELFSKE